MIFELNSRRWLSWIPFFIIAFAVLFASIWYLYPEPSEFPMDDTYIHFVYSQNLIDYGELMFVSPDEDGVGTTSLLWVLLLATGYSLGLTLHLTAKLLGIASLITVGIQIYLLLKPKFDTRISLLCALFIVLSGNVLWFALSGMETVLFLALGLLALIVYRNRKWSWLGIVLGLMILTRPEALVLASVIILVELIRRKRVHSGIVRTAIFMIVLAAPWFGYLYIRTGHILPTSAIGKQLSSIVGIQYVIEKNVGLAWIARFPALVCMGAWISFLIEFALGGISLPPPEINVFNSAGGVHYAISFWALLGISTVVIPLLWIAIKHISNLRFWQNWINDDEFQPLFILIPWCVLHNIAYLVFLPIPGTASRYGAINHVLLWLALIISLFHLTQQKWVRVYRTLWLLMITSANLVYWNAVYDANIEHLTKVRIPSANYLQNNISEEDLCAANDIGVLSFYGKRPILDLGGLVNPDIPVIFLQGKLDHYIADNGVTCLILPGRSGTLEDGWFDLAKIMGFADTSIFRLRQIAIFEIDRDRWLQGYLSTNNYQASVTIYQLEYPTLKRSKISNSQEKTR